MGTLNVKEQEALIREHVRLYMEKNKAWRQDSEDVGSLFRGQVSSFIMSVSIIYAVQQDAYLRTSSTDLFVMAVWYLMFAVAAVFVNTYLKNHILGAQEPPVGLVFFRAIYWILQSIQNYYMFLLINLVKEQVARSVSEDSWDHYNLIPISFTVILYYMFEEIRQKFTRSSITRIRRRRRQQQQQQRQNSHVHLLHVHDAITAHGS